MFDTEDEFYCTKKHVFILSRQTSSLHRFSLEDIKLKGRMIESVWDHSFVTPINAKPGNIIFAKAFENFFCLGVRGEDGPQFTLQIWNEKLGKAEHLALKADKLYRMDLIKEKLYRNPILVLFGTSFLLERSLEAIDLNTFSQKSKAEASNSITVQHNIINFDAFDLYVFEQNQLLFKNKKLFFTLRHQANNDFLLYEQFLLKHGFSVIHCKAKTLDCNVTEGALRHIEARWTYAVSILVSSAAGFLDCLKSVEKFHRVENIVVHDIDYGSELEAFVMSNSMTAVLPPGCRLLFINQKESTASLYTRKLLAKLREENFTNEFFLLEYDRAFPQNLGSIIINFLK